MRRFVTFLGAIGCVLLVVGGCARTVTVPVAEVEVAAPAPIVVVTSSTDSGVGSLRQVVADAPAGGIVTFDAAVTTVTLTSGHVLIDKNLTIAGPVGGTVVISGNDASRVFFVATGGVHAVFENLTIEHGRADYGGGVKIDSAATETYSSVTFIECTVADNVATQDGGGVYVHGGLFMERTTVRDNTAPGFGGGVFYYGPPTPFTSATGTVVNSTFAGNRAQQGGGLYNSEGLLTIAFSTITANQSQYDLGGGVGTINDDAVQTNLLGTIVVGNTSESGSPYNDLYAAEAIQPFGSLGYNLVGFGSGAANVATSFTAVGDVTSLTTVGLAAFADNGGPTQTLALEAASPAIDAVPAAACVDASGAALVVDQRGVARPLGTNCDIGAFETEATATTVVTNGDDSGVGSLRQVVADAAPGATVTFAPSVTEVVLTSGSLVVDKDLTIAGPEGATMTIRGDDAFADSVVQVPVAGVDVVLRNLTITGGNAQNGGGVVVRWPSPLWDDPPPSLSLIRCTVVDNFASVEGGGVYAEGNLYIEATTVSGNTTGAYGYAGGVSYFGTDVVGTVPYPTSGTIVDSTITGNAAQYAGGVENFNGALRILFTTITGNTAVRDAGGIYSYNDALTRTTLKGTVVVGNTSANGADDVFANSTTNRYQSLGYNVIGAGAGKVDFALEFLADGDLTQVPDAGLLALAANGGPTQTHALASTSPALDRVPPSACTDLADAAVASDQRGVQRPQGVNCDSGAFELEGGATSYLLYVAVAPAASGTVDGAGMYAPGATATLTATPADHWRFSHWSGDLTGSDNPASFAMDAGKSVVANFAQILYPVTATMDGGGLVLHDPLGPAYPYGTVVTVTAVPTDDWGFSFWSGALTGPFNPGSLMVTGPMAYTAHFVRWYPLTLQAVGGGAVAANPPQESFIDGTVVTLTATPDAGWRFEEWSGDLTGSTNPATVTMDAAKSVTATFVHDTFTVTTHVDGSGSVVGGGVYEPGATAMLTAVPGAGWRFDHWSGDAGGATNPLELAVSGDLDVTAHFVLTHVLEVSVQGVGSVLLDPPGGVYDHGTVVTLTASADPGWHFGQWSGDLTGSTNPATVTMDAAKTVTATFVQDTFTVTTHVEGSGSVDGGGAYPPGSTATLTAVPDAGSRFDHWSGDASGSTNPLELTVSGDLDVTANFVLIHALQVTVEGSGAVTLDPSGGVYDHGTIVTLIATADPGWTFQTWTGAVTGTVNPATVTMDAAKTVTATFQPILGPTLTVAVEGSGHVTSTPAGIDCGPTGGSCVAAFKKNTKVTLHATAEDGAAFSGWTGALTSVAPDVTLRLNADKAIEAHFVELNGPAITVLPTASFSGSTVVVEGSLLCASGSHDLDVAILQSVRVGKVYLFVSASTTVVGAVCGQPWTATLVAEYGRFARGEAAVTVATDGITTTQAVQLR